MKKLLTAVAVAACCLTAAGAQAQGNITSELDASLRLGLGFTTDPEVEMTFNNYGSRLRWNGSADAGDGLKAITYLEFGFDQDSGVNNTRQAWLGVEGDFGTLKGGKQYSAFYDAVTSAVDIAYWGSCYQEFACSRQSSQLKFTSAGEGDLQFMASALLIDNDADNDFIDGLDVGAKLTSGDMTIGVGATLLIGNSGVGVNFLGEPAIVDFGTGIGLGVSASLPVGEGNASATVQLANDNYFGGQDNGIAITGTYSIDQMYAVVGIRNADNTPYNITLGYVKPIIDEKALTYIEVGIADSDTFGSEVDVIARAVMIFNLDLLSTGG